MLIRMVRPLVLVLVALIIFFVFVATANVNQAAPLQSATPTPLSPQPVGVRVPRYQPTVDANTVAMYRFDSVIGNVVPDELGLHPGTLNGNASLTAGLFGHALRTDGVGSYMRIGNLGALSAGTLEAYLDLSSACQYASSHFSIISAGGEYGSGQSALRMFVDGMMMFQIGNYGWHNVDTGINPCRYLAGGDTSPYFYPTPVAWPYEKWRFHHVATTWGPRGIEFWVDGVLHGVSADPLPPMYDYTYRCNPQMQLASAIYPVCQSPTLGLVPGAYPGGTDNYAAWLLGCDASSSCFNGRIDEVRISNIQRTFSPIYDPTPVPGGMATPTRTATPSAPLPNFSVTGISAPVVTTDYMTKTISVRVSNLGTQSFNRAPQSQVQVGQQAGGRRTRPANLRAPDAETGSYFFYVDVYVDRPPLGRNDPGNCPALGGGTSWSWVYALGIGETVSVPIDCWVAPGEHSFYAQLDICDDSSGTLCSLAHGFVVETNDDDNSFPATGRVSSASPFDFLPLIRR